MVDYDVVVIGGGHNGLTAAGYMAKEGLKTLVVEKRDVVGGAGVTEEVDGLSFNLGATGIVAWLRPEVIRDLELERFGLELAPMDPMYTVPFPDGEHISLYSDIDNACREIERFSAKDAQAYREFMQRWDTLKQFLDPALTNPPPPFTNLVGAMSSSPEMLEMLRSMMFSTLKKSLDDTFESEYLKSALLVLALDGSHLGPSAASLAVLLFHTSFSPAWRGARGGIGSVIRAMEKADKHYGVTIKTGSTVENIMIARGKAVGVRLSTGEEISAKVVISNADLQQTFLKMVGDEHLNESFVQQIKNIRCEATGMTLNLVLGEMPDFSLPQDRLESSIGICPSWQYAEKAWYEYTINEIPEKPLLFGVVKHPRNNKRVMTMFVYPLPYELNEGNWDERKEETFDRAIDVVAEYAPNAKRSVISRYGLTPLDLERTLSLPRGDPFHGIATWDQMLSFRPLVGHADYRTPIANLYLCGAGVHPGGGVSGAPGHNAAKVALDDWKRGKIEEEIRAQVPKEKAKQVAQVISESGSVMMAIEGISREGDRLAVKGSVIGSWPSKMYVNLKDTLNMAKLILTPQVILYILSLPFLALKRKWREK